MQQTWTEGNPAVTKRDELEIDSNYDDSGARHDPK